MTTPDGLLCPYCHERFRLRADGSLPHHTGTRRRKLPDGAWAHCCEGCGQMPALAAVLTEGGQAT